MKGTLLKNIIAAALIGVSTLGLSSKVNAEAENVNNFNNIMTGASNYLKSYRSGANGENVKIREDPNDPTGNSDIILPKIGYMDENYNWVGGKYEIGLFKYNHRHMDIVGWATNNNYWSNKYPSLFGGYFDGRINTDKLASGEKPEGIIIVSDVDGDGIGNKNATFEDAFYLSGDDGIAYYYKDIIINGKRGDINEFPGIVYGGTTIFPPMVISPYSEVPSEIRGARAVYDFGKRTDKTGPLDLKEMAEHWLTTDSNSLNYWANGSDQNTDGKVNFKDFAILGNNWSPSDYLDN